MTTAHLDTFARDHLPPPDAQPDYLFALPSLQFPPQLNCATELLDRAVAEGRGSRLCIQAPGLRWSYADLQARANRIAQVLVHDMGLVPGNRVLLRAPNSPMLAACWFAVVKAGGIAVGSMPLLRAAELRQIIDKAQISHALCDLRLAEELKLAAADCPGLRELRHFNDAGATGLEAAMAAFDGQFRNVDTADDDTSPRARCISTAMSWRPAPAGRRTCCVPSPTMCSSAARRWPSPSAWAACCCSR
jgi:2-aminobenzoate-CoA ligase